MTDTSSSGAAPARVTGSTLVVVNTGSRVGSEAPGDIALCLGDAGVNFDALRATSSPEEIAAAVRDALAAGASRVIVGGGDGTVSLVASLLLGGTTALGVLPLGTGNDFARNLRIPRDLARACRVVAAGQVRAVPVGVAHGRSFLNALSFGVSSAITERLSPELKRRAGPLAYPAAAVAEALDAAPFRMRMDVDGARHEGDALQVVVGNGRYHGGGTLVAPGAKLADARLDVYVLGARAGPDDSSVAARLKNAFALARLGLLLRRGRHLEHPLVQHFQCTSVTIECEPPQQLDVDGELRGETPVRCEVRAAALRVLVP